MRPPTRTAASLLAAGLLGTALTACTSQDTPTPTTTTPALATTDARAEAYRKSEEAVQQWTKLDFTQPIPDTASFVAPTLRSSQNETIANIAKQGIRRVDKTPPTTDSIKAVGYEQSPPQTTVLVCATSNTRLIDANGRDVTVDEHNQPIPDKPTLRAAYFLLDSPDGGVTWQITETSLAPVEKCGATPSSPA